MVNSEAKVSAPAETAIFTIISQIKSQQRDLQCVYDRIYKVSTKVNERNLSPEIDRTSDYKNEPKPREVTVVNELQDIFNNNRSLYGELCEIATHLEDNI